MSVKRINLLIVEDQVDDFELLKLTLEEAGLLVDCLRVDSEAAMLVALGERKWDAILSDFSMPNFSGLEALSLHQMSSQDIPFIFVSGTIGEESAVQCMKAGASDLVLKGHGRIVTILRRELQEADNRRAQRASDDRYRRIVEQASDGIWTSDDRGKLTFANTKMAAILRIPSDQLIGRPITELVAPCHLSELDKLLASSVQRGEPLPLDFLRADGHIAQTLVTLSKLDEGGILGTVTDITQLRTLERRLLDSAKMEAIGRLAAGVAHDFNNTLGIILGFGRLLLEDLQGTEHEESLQDILKAADSSSTLIQQLLAVGRQKRLVREVVNLNESLEDLRRMLAKAAGDGTSLQLRAEAQPDLVELDKDMLSQVLLNLTLNARDALPKNGEEPGKIVICTYHLVLDDEAARAVHSDLVPGAYVVLSVSDNGHGMDAATRSRIFEPFFTTKSAGEGTGLGMSSVYGLVRQSGGHIWVYSEPARGTTFKIYLPALAVRDSGAEVLASVPIPADEKTVLLIDDADTTRKVLRECLRRDGYEVLEARHGWDALTVAQDFEGVIAVAICDITMPGLAGPEVMKLLLQQRPDVKVVFTSGQGAEFCSLPDPARLPHTFIEKPVVPKALLRQLQSLLQEPAASS